MNEADGRLLFENSGATRRGHQPDLDGASNPRTTICFPFTGDSIGGSHISVLGLLKQLDPARFRIIVIPESLDGQVSRMFGAFEQAPDPVPAQRPFIRGEPFGPGKFARTLTSLLPRVRFLRQHKVDIVHTNDGRSHAGWALAARLAGARLVWHHRGDPGALGLRLLAPLLAHKVLTVSEFSLPPKGLWSAADKAQVVHSPFDIRLRVDREEARGALAAELGLAQDTLVLGFFGAFVPRKRPHLFVEAVARVRERVGRPVVGLMFGEAKDEASEMALRERIRDSGATEFVRIMGYRTPGSFWIAACDQLLVPAIGEPFGRTLIEAMLVGTPVVATRSGGNVEALRNGNGVLVPPDDPSALADGCARLANDPQLALVIAEKAEIDARQRFGVERHCAQVTEVYESLTSPPATSAFPVGSASA
jgi:glycosyltransferase involved in cell wall biosynthesis